MRYPEMVKTNARHRGPRESVKQTNQVLDAQASITHLYKMFETNGVKRAELATSVNADYNSTRPQEMDRLRKETLAVRGGEL